MKSNNEQPRHWYGAFANYGPFYRNDTSSKPSTKWNHLLIEGGLYAPEFHLRGAGRFIFIENADEQQMLVTQLSIPDQPEHASGKYRRKSDVMTLRRRGVLAYEPEALRKADLDDELVDRLRALIFFQAAPRSDLRKAREALEITAYGKWHSNLRTLRANEVQWGATLPRWA